MAGSQLDKQTAAETLRWILLNKTDRLAQGVRDELLDLADILVGYPRPGAVEIQPGIQGATGPKAPSPGTQPSGRVTKVALVIGHNKAGNQGAWLDYGTIKESEWVFNGKVADLIMAKGVEGVEFKKFERVYTGSYTKEIAAVYKKVNAWKPDFVLELHFNSFQSSNYCCMLVAKTASEKSKQIAQILHDEFTGKLKIPGQGLILRTKGQRGGASLYGAAAPTVLTEPFFGDNPDHCKLVDKLGHVGIADIYRAAIAKAAAVVA